MQAVERTLEEDLATLCRLAEEAGALALTYRAQGGGETWNKASGGPVTEADLAVNRLCLARLSAARPGYGWLSEETLDDPGARSQSRIWVVDPIDGTKAYMRGGDDWSIGLAVIEDGEPVAGAIYAPALGRMYAARRGAGARLNGEPIRTSTRAAEAGLRLIANEGVVSHPGWPEPWPEVVLARPKPNSTLLRLALVASGDWDAALVLGEKADWDIAAGALLISEAGGRATEHTGAPLRFNQTVPAQPSVVASGKGVHDLLVRRAGIVKVPDPQKRAASRPATSPAEGRE